MATRFLAQLAPMRKGNRKGKLKQKSGIAVGSIVTHADNVMFAKEKSGWTAGLLQNGFSNRRKPNSQQFHTGKAAEMDIYGIGPLRLSI
jgi:hypothetical protein